MVQRASVYRDEACLRLQRFLDSFFDGRPPHTVLDAGAGQMLPIDFPPSVHLVALDVSPEELERNENADEKIVADLQKADLGGRSFDLILCWNVLEHLPRPEDAVARMASWLRLGGALVIGVPNLWSTKGLVTKLTPHAFHEWVYQHVFQIREVTPFKTYLRRSISPGNLERLAAAKGLELVYSETYTGEMEDQLPRPLRAALRTWSEVFRAASWNSLDPSLSEHVAVFAKRVH